MEDHTMRTPLFQRFGRPPRSTASAGRRLSRLSPAALAAAVAFVVVGALASAPSAHAADPARYEIVNVRTGLRADVMWASTSPFAATFLWPDNTSLSQEFELLDRGGGFFRIKARHSGQCLMLDWRAGTYSNGTPVMQYPFCDAGYAPSEWSIAWVGHTCMCFPTTMILKNRATGRCLDANGPSGTPGERSVLSQWDCIAADDVWNTANQSWNLLQL
ncbi:RICIN domain-containing protein [Kitasatospora griseola]|uniref:RICIN domain-containing protein n=1 Tax=Kitasatospora griseola TaxID=2064 RepID=UPI00166F91A3|nr:RICIN domain-containing protein [Kitasatospora griseola]